MEVEYVKGKAYFSDTLNKIKQYPYLAQDLTCDVLIVGGGINGCIVNYYFSKAGIDCALIEKNRMAFTNSSIATALLEYQLDDHAQTLKNFYTKQEIINIYNLGLESLQEINRLIGRLGNFCHYSKRDTVLYTLDDQQVEEIKREFDFRQKNGFDVDFLDEYNNPFCFNLKAGIYAKDGGAEFNPYLFSKQMIESSLNQNKIFENTEAKEIIYLNDGKVKVITNYGIEIICNKIICATGYNTERFSDKILCKKMITYSVVTKPIDGFIWKNKALLQDNEKPYHYIRFSHDNRLIIGGEDIPFKKAIIKEKQAFKKYDNLLNYTKKLFPDFENQIKAEYCFAGAFSEIEDNLAVFGADNKNTNLWYALGYGANGIIYCIYGAQALIKLYNGQKDKMLKYFSSNRKLP